MIDAEALGRQLAFLPDRCYRLVRRPIVVDSPWSCQLEAI